MINCTFVVIIETTIHFGAPGLLASVASPFVSWWAWRSRHDLPRIATALRRRPLPGNHQEEAGQLPAPELPPTADPKSGERL